MTNDQLVTRHGPLPRLTPGLSWSSYYKTRATEHLLTDGDTEFTTVAYVHKVTRNDEIYSTRVRCIRAGGMTTLVMRTYNTGKLKTKSRRVYSPADWFAFVGLTRPVAKVEQWF